MSTKNFLKHLVMGVLLLTTGKVVGQSTTPGNVAAFGSDFFGWNTNAANGFPLMVRHDLNQPIDFYTNSLHRMRLYNNDVGSLPLLGGGTVGYPRNGFLGISESPGPRAGCSLINRSQGETPAAGLPSSATLWLTAMVSLSRPVHDEMHHPARG